MDEHLHTGEPSLQRHPAVNLEALPSGLRSSGPALWGSSATANSTSGLEGKKAAAALSVVLRLLFPGTSFLSCQLAVSPQVCVSTDNAVQLKQNEGQLSLLHAHRSLAGHVISIATPLSSSVTVDRRRRLIDVDTAAACTGVACVRVTCVPLLYGVGPRLPALLAAVRLGGAAGLWEAYEHCCRELPCVGSVTLASPPVSNSSCSKDCKARGDDELDREVVNLLLLAAMAGTDVLLYGQGVVQDMAVLLGILRLGQAYYYVPGIGVVPEDESSSPVSTDTLASSRPASEGGVLADGEADYGSSGAPPVNSSAATDAGQAGNVASGSSGDDEEDGGKASARGSKPARGGCQDGLGSGSGRAPDDAGDGQSSLALEPSPGSASKVGGETEDGYQDMPRKPCPRSLPPAVTDNGRIAAAAAVAAGADNGQESGGSMSNSSSTSVARPLSDPGDLAPAAGDELNAVSSLLTPGTQGSWGGANQGHLDDAWHTAASGKLRGAVHTSAGARRGDADDDGASCTSSGRPSDGLEYVAADYGGMAVEQLASKVQAGGLRQDPLAQCFCCRELANCWRLSSRAHTLKAMHILAPLAYCLFAVKLAVQYPFQWLRYHPFQLALQVTVGFANVCFGHRNCSPPRVAEVLSVVHYVIYCVLHAPLMYYWALLRVVQDMSATAVDGAAAAAARSYTHQLNNLLHFLLGSIIITPMFEVRWGLWMALLPVTGAVWVMFVCLTVQQILLLDLPSGAHVCLVYLAVMLHTCVVPARLVYVRERNSRAAFKDKVMHDLAEAQVLAT